MLSVNVSVDVVKEERYVGIILQNSFIWPFSSFVNLDMF